MGRSTGNMAKSQDDDLWALAHAERTALAEDLSGLDIEQWGMALCVGSGMSSRFSPISPRRQG